MNLNYILICISICKMFGKASAKEAFLDFQEKTNDAWDDGDDDLIRSSITNKKLTPKIDLSKHSNNFSSKSHHKTPHKTTANSRCTNSLKSTQHDANKILKFNKLLKEATLDLGFFLLFTNYFLK